MYLPDRFRIEDRDVIRRFIDENSFGQLISNVNGQLESNHVPFLLSADGGQLATHMARQNPQLQGLDGADVLVTLQGPHAYISPGWYESFGVPTWSYQAVHISGRCQLFDDTDQLQQMVEKLTKKYEAAMAEPWQPTYPPAMLEAIVGLRIEVQGVQCKYKLSQHRSESERANVIRELEARGEQPLASAMRDSEAG